MKIYMTVPLMMISTLAFGNPAQFSGYPQGESPPAVSATTCANQVPLASPPGTPSGAAPVMGCNDKTLSPIKAEVSALLRDPTFQAFLSSLTLKFASDGQSLIMADSVVFWSGVVEMVAIDFNVKITGDASSMLQPVGRIGGQVLVDAHGNYSVFAVQSSIGVTHPVAP